MEGRLALRRELLYSFLLVADRTKGMHRAPFGWAGPGVVEILTKWLNSARLETRTKESNVCASIRVLNPDA